MCVIGNTAQTAYTCFLCAFQQHLAIGKRTSPSALFINDQVTLITTVHSHDCFHGSNSTCLFDTLPAGSAVAHIKM